MGDNAKPPPVKLSLKSTLIVFGLLIAYALLQPTLEGWLGVDLPSFNEDPQQVLPADSRPAAPEQLPASSVEHPAATVSETKITPPTPSTAGSQSEPQSTSTRDNKPIPKLGELHDVGGNVFKSTAGLYYRPGSQEGHRLKHILRHHEDAPSRPVHGVFDGDRNEVFAVIDEAYLYTFDHGPPRVTQEQDDGRTIYIVDLGRRIGYVGGQKGRRDNHPAATQVQLILEGTNVITAYPIRISHRGR